MTSKRKEAVAQWATVRAEVQEKVPARIIEAAQFKPYGQRRKDGNSYALRLPGFSWEVFAPNRETALAECWSALLNNLLDATRRADLHQAWAVVPPPTPYTVAPFAGASVVYDANGGAVTGPINGEAARLFAAAPELLAASYNARNVLAALVTGDLKAVKADSAALAELRAAIAKAGGR